MADAEATIHLIDDDEAIRKALLRLLGTEGYQVKVHDSAEDFLKRHDPDAPGCAILDVRLPGMGGFEVQAVLNERDVDCPVIFLTGRGDIPTSVRAMKAGAVDFLTKPFDAGCVLAAVSLALKRDAEARRAAEQRRMAQRRLATLTAREREVMGCVVAGRLNKQIAAELGTVEKTIKVHRGRMMEKMGVRNVADLVRLSSLVPVAGDPVGPRASYAVAAPATKRMTGDVAPDNGHRG